LFFSGKGILETGSPFLFLSSHNYCVIKLIDANMEAGYHTVVWNADNHASGMYFVKMHAGNYISTQKLMLVK